MQRTMSPAPFFVAIRPDCHIHVILVHLQSRVRSAEIVPRVLQQRRGPVLPPDRTPGERAHTPLGPSRTHVAQINLAATAERTGGRIVQICGFQGLDHLRETRML